MDIFDLRNVIKDFKIEDEKIIQILGTNETKVYENTKANLTRTINTCKKQMEDTSKGEKMFRLNAKIFKIVMPFFLISLVFSFIFAFISALKTDIFSVGIASLITVLAATLFLITREYDRQNNIKLSELEKVLDVTKKLPKTLEKFEE